MKAIFGHAGAFNSVTNPGDSEKFHQKKQDLKALWRSLRKYEDLLSLYFYFFVVVVVFRSNLVK